MSGQGAERGEARGHGIYEKGPRASRQPPGALAGLLSAVVASLLASLLAPGCSGGGASPNAPQPALATSPGAAEAFGLLRRRWAGAKRAERLELEPYVLALRETYAREPVASVADVYLAWIALEKGDYERARQLAEAAGRPHPGNVRDLSQLVDGATLGRSGQPEAALEKLWPLLGKLLDPYARELLHEEAVVAAVASHRWTDAIALLDIWLRDAPEEDQTTVLEIARGLLTQMPAASLEQALSKMRADAEENGTAHSDVLEKALAKRLAAVALDRGDSALARRLLAQNGALASLGEVGNDVVELASKLDVPQVNGRRVGLLLPDGNTLARSRGADASLGVLWALDLLGEVAAAGSDRLVVAHDGPAAADTRRALAALDAEGASVLIGGFDADQSRRIAEFSDHEGVASLLLTPPPSLAPGGWAFSLGPADDSAAGPLLSAIAERGARTVAVVGASAALVGQGAATVLPSADCVALVPGQATRRYPTASWRSQRADALLALGDARCARDALDEAAEAKLPLLLALGSEAASLALPPPPGAPPSRRAKRRALVAALGCFPVDPRGQPNAEIAAFEAKRGSAPSYWTVLAREAAVVASRAVAALPLDRTLDAAEVTRRRGLVRSALGASEPSPCMGLRPSTGLPGATFQVIDVPVP